MKATPTRGQLLFRYAWYEGHKPGLEIVRFISQSLADESCTQETWEVRDIQTRQRIRCPVGHYYGTRLEAFRAHLRDAQETFRANRVKIVEIRDTNKVLSAHMAMIREEIAKEKVTLAYLEHRA